MPGSTVVRILLGALWGLAYNQKRRLPYCSLLIYRALFFKECGGGIIINV